MKADLIAPSCWRVDGRLRTGIVKNCLHAAYLEYHWNGQGIEAVFEVNQVL